VRDELRCEAGQEKKSPMSESLFSERVFCRSRRHSGVPPRFALTRDTLEVYCRQVSNTPDSIKHNTRREQQSHGEIAG